jgi:eukaryotic-like serine/threonine-protein kinase
VGELIADRYELQASVGTGGMSTVYRAFDTLLERNVALKILHERYGEDEDYIARFRREARAAARLSHPNIVTVIDRGEQGGKEFIVFELVEGQNLKELVERRGPLPVRRALELGLAVGRALAFAHGEGIIHRDVKPQNVLLDADGRAKVTDFGIARTIDAVGTTETGTVLGTSHYVAPEQARGERVDAQTDVYSFGVVLWELLAGDVPYGGENFLTVAMRHVNDPVPSVLDRRPDTPLRLATLIERCMAKEPADRPDSMEAVVDELEACLAELDAKEGGEATMIVRRPVQRVRRPRSRRERPARPLLLPILAALLLVGVAGALLLGRGDGDNAGAGAGAGAGADEVQLEGVAAYDPPPGDGDEHDDDAGNATDGDPETYWPTESYNASLELLGKQGVGLVLDAGARKKLDRIAVTTDTPGFTAEIRAGGSPEGPFETVGENKPVGTSTTWELDGADARYYVVWITELDGNAHVNEVKAS